MRHETAVRRNSFHSATLPADSAHTFHLAAAMETVGSGATASLLTLDIPYARCAAACLALH